MLRTSVTKDPLPSARRASVMTMTQGDVPSKVHNTLFVVFGQFIDHDLTQAPIHVKGNTDPHPKIKLEAMLHNNFE